MWFWIVPPRKTQKEGKEGKEKETISETKIREVKITDTVKTTDAVKITDAAKITDISSPVIARGLNDSAVPGVDGAAAGRSFIQPEERPAVDANVLNEPLQGPSS